MKKYHVFKINLVVLNILSIILLALIIAFSIVFFPEHMKEVQALLNDIKFSFMFLPLLIIYFTGHELLHALGYIINGANPQKITFGAELEKTVLYCLCKDEVSKRNILISLMFPLFFLTIVAYPIAIIFHYPILLVLSILNFSGAAGDIMYFLFIVKLDKELKYSELDDGIAFALICKDDPSKYKHIGLDYIGPTSEISRKDFKRVKISKLSFVIFAFALILLIMGILIKI